MISRFLSLLVIVWALGFAVFAITLPRPAGDAMTDAVVVLTGGAGRLERGLDLLARHRARRLFLSGTDRTVRKKELAARTGRPQALFDCCVDLGKDSVDTRSNAKETAQWLGAHRFRSVRLITTDWHMPRAHHDLAAATRGLGVTILVDAVPSHPSFTTLFTEYQKYLLRRAAAPFGY
ncbi:YdcF family protein [Sphingomonas morindae]|uniref:YdcF family protein n=1 Tax=Sphingomonas morindae TaxID=1541170 RepID=A0ABY4X5T4_9SPHN|nr:YdcF family protein [Sphingomonas morindae]USI72236.1 YdcF family protein [Sphingomonas morindae]